VYPIHIATSNKFLYAVMTLSFKSMAILVPSLYPLSLFLLKHNYSQSHNIALPTRTASMPQATTIKA